VESREQLESAEDTLIGEHSNPSSPPTHTQEFQRGDQAGRYVILERVGAGGMGVVYAAWDPKLDRKVALKLLHINQANHSPRLEREAMAMARLTHPNVIVVHDFGEVDGVGEAGRRLFVAMEFVEGETLKRWVEHEPEPRSWSAVLEVLLAAGRGLAAAHAHGLIHRDFKPDNVMVGVDGRVRVMDFGLVRTSTDASDDADRAAAIEQINEASIEVSNALDSELTLAGSLLGTPAYMAPEQLRGESIDARADQFSYCVAAWQCLYGVRPFAGDSPISMFYAISQANFREPPPGRTVPSWIRRALERGLALDPAARWPDMPSLLTALSHDPTAWPAAKRRRLLVGGAFVAVAMIAATAAIVRRAEPPPSPCARAGDELRELWTSERRAGLEAAFAASPLIYADETWDRVGARLDDWAAGWIDAREATCEESLIRHALSAELLDLGMACLDQRRDRFAALVELFAAADDTVIEKAVEAVEALPELEICSDRSWLIATVRPPEDQALARAVAELREDIARVVVKVDGGKASDAGELAAQTVARAVELGWLPVIAEASLQRGRVDHEVGEFPSARANLEQAYFTARRSGHDEVTIQAAYSLVYSLSLGLGEFDSAAVWINHARAEAERIGRDDLLADVHASVGIHHYLKSETKLAAAAFAQALELHAGAQSAGLAAAHINYGTILTQVDRSQRERAFAELELGLAMLEHALGPQHPSVATALSNYATVHGYFNQRREAIAMLERALVIHTRVHGPKHPMTALVELNLSTNLVALPDELSERDELTRALELARRSSATHREVFDAQHGMVAQSERTIGEALRRLGRPEQAIAHLDAALAIWIASFGEPHAEAERVHLAWAGCDVDLGNLADARARLEMILGREAATAKTRDKTKLALAELIADEDPRRATILLEEAKPYFEETGDEREQARVAALERALNIDTKTENAPTP